MDSQHSLHAELQESRYTLAAGEVVIGKLVALDSSGMPLVSFPLNLSSQPIAAVSTVATTAQKIGREVVLMFADGDLGRPLIIGFIYSPLQEIIENFDLISAQQENQSKDKSASVSAVLGGRDASTLVDGQKVTLEAQQEIVLKCGDASITLNKSGKIMIRGKYILNRSTGVNRILGGSVQVN